MYNADKKNNEMSTAFLWFFSVLSLFAAFMIYFLSSYYFIDPEKDFDLLGNYKPEISRKTEDLKSYDFSIFGSEKFNSLKDSYWHEYDASSFTTGNKEPFVRKAN